MKTKMLEVSVDYLQRLKVLSEVEFHVLAFSFVSGFSGFYPLLPNFCPGLRVLAPLKAPFK